MALKYIIIAKIRLTLAKDLKIARRYKDYNLIDILKKQSKKYPKIKD